MKVLHLKQGSDAWLERRQTSITSTDAGVILGVNPWKSRKDLFREKLGLQEREPLNDKMIEGQVLEEEARKKYEKTQGIVPPLVVAHDTEAWAMASLDGYDKENNLIVEIKCGEKSYWKAMAGEIPPYYYAQMQHALWVSGASLCHYYCYRPDEKAVLIPVLRDELYITRMIEEERRFYKELLEYAPNEASANREEIKEKLRCYEEKKGMIADLQQEVDSLKEEILTLCSHVETECEEWQISRSYVKGRVQYDEIPSLKGIDLEKFRSPGNYIWKITKGKNGRTNGNT